MWCKWELVFKEGLQMNTYQVYEYSWYWANVQTTPQLSLIIWFLGLCTLVLSLVVGFVCVNSAIKQSEVLIGQLTQWEINAICIHVHVHKTHIWSYRCCCSCIFSLDRCWGSWPTISGLLTSVLLQKTWCWTVITHSDFLLWPPSLLLHTTCTVI